MDDPVDNEDSGMIRFDDHFANTTTAFIRYNADEAVSTTPTGSLTALTKYDTKFTNGKFELLHVFTPTVVNEFKFGLNQDNYHSGTLSPTPYTLSVSGFSSLAGDTTSDYPSASGPVSWRGGVGNSTFEALQLNVRRPFSNGLLLTSNHMWSHSINDGSIGEGDSDTPQDSFCGACDKGDSDDDIRNFSICPWFISYHLVQAEPT